MSTTTHANTTAPTYSQLARFVKLRNESPFASNLQFEFDAKECGFDAGDLGKCEKEVNLLNRMPVYIWRTPNGILVEHNGRMELTRM